MQPSEHTTTTSSGTSNVLNVLPYPKILGFNDVPEISGQFVYVIKAYEENGLAILINRNIENNEVSITINDFDGNDINLNDENGKYYKHALDFATFDSPKFVSLMKYAKIDKMIVYISITNDTPVLVDMRTSLNKFYGPGMIKDLFSKIYPTQEVIKTVALDDNTIDAIKNGSGSYKGSLILKCSKFKTIVRGKELLPLYAKIR